MVRQLWCASLERKDMLVKDAITLLQSLPQDAVLVAHTEGMSAEVGKGILRPGAHTVEEGALIAGFTAKELKREKYEFFLFEKSNVVVYGLVRNCFEEDI
jgi:hypothetical protein